MTARAPRLEPASRRPPKLLRSIVRRFGWDLVPHGGAPGAMAQLEIAQVRDGERRFRFAVLDPRNTVQAALMGGRFFEHEDLAHIAAAFPPGGVFVDVGANIGNHAIYAAGCMGARRVIAFEPGALAHALLTLNLALNGLSDVVEARRLGVSSAAGTARLSPADLRSLGQQEVTVGEGEAVALDTLDSQLAGERVDFIKIDVEGHEMEALAGMTATLRDSRPRLFVEVAARNEPAFAALLPAIGYHVVRRAQEFDVCANYLIEPRT